jgi:hypothetical protein
MKIKSIQVKRENERGSVVIFTILNVSVVFVA